MPADREPHNAFGQPTGLWPGQDIPRQAGGPSLPWPEAEVTSSPPPPARTGGGDLPWPERPDAGHRDAAWPQDEPTVHGDPGWAPHDDAGWAGPGPAGDAVRGAGAAATATLTGPPPVDAPHDPATGGPGRPPAPPLAPGTTP
ncbi:hypothetical protein AB0F83_18000, partial [Micromonospora chalcea]